MSQQSSSSKPRGAYQNVDHGPGLFSHGHFDHPARRCDEAGVQTGYYEFATYEDYRRAYEHGMHRPEDVLVAQDADDGVYHEIRIRYVPGKVDETTKKPLVGTAAEHLITIYNERRLLGMCLSFHGHVPAYSNSKDQKPIDDQLARCGRQQEVLAETLLLSPTHRDIRTVGGTLTSLLNASSTENPADSAYMLAPVLLPEPGCVAGPSLHVSINEFPSDYAVASSGSSTVVEEIEEPKDRLKPIKGEQNPEVNERSFNNGPSAYIAHRESAFLDKASCLNRAQSLDSLASVRPKPLGDCNCSRSSIDEHSVCSSQKSSGVPKSEILGLSSINPSIPRVSEEQNCDLSCMDCGLFTSHTSQCWINKTIVSLRTIEELSVSQIRELAESTARFDPGPWTTHINIPREPSHDSQTRMTDLAEVIRNLDSVPEYSYLHKLDDQSTVLLWGITSSESIEILSSPVYQ